MLRVVRNSSFLRSNLLTSRSFARPVWASVDPDTMGKDGVHTVQYFINKKWHSTENPTPFPDPVTGETMFQVSEIPTSVVPTFTQSAQAVPRSGLHNPLKNPERYVNYGKITARVAEEMNKKEVEEFFIKLIRRVIPKSYEQAKGELVVTRDFIYNFCGDNVRFLAQGNNILSGNHTGQFSSSYRWPFGPVTIISPFNFPLEIPVLQLMGALYMGNKVFLKPDSKASPVMEQFVRLLHYCGMPEDDVDLLLADGKTTQNFLTTSPIQMTQFTGSSKVAEILAKELNGRLKVEDAGWDWKIIGPDYYENEAKEIAHVCDQDAYGFSGQKCSAQSVLFVHKKWIKKGFLDELKMLAEQRNYKDETLNPVLTVKNEDFLEHVEKLTTSFNGKVLWGGKVAPNEGDFKHNIPAQYGSFLPTAIEIPINRIKLNNKKKLKILTKEIFGPFQVIIPYGDNDIDKVLEIVNSASHHLTAAVVSKDINFQQYILANTINGTTYTGVKARTTGAPQNHWFGPAGDPRGAGIGTKDAIRLVWSCHREIIHDQGPCNPNFTYPKRT